MTGQKLGFPDCGTCDWPVEIIKTIEPMQKVLKNRCQSCKKSDNFLEKYTSRSISPIWWSCVNVLLFKLQKHTGDAFILILQEVDFFRMVFYLVFKHLKHTQEMHLSYYKWCTFPHGDPVLMKFWNRLDVQPFFTIPI